MFVYNDINYFKYLCSLDLTNGLKLYNHCLSRLQEQKEQILDDRLWDIYMNRSEDQKDLTFEDFKKRQLSEIKNKTEIENMNHNEKNQEEERIINLNKKIIEFDKERLDKNGYKQNVKGENNPNKRRITKIIKK